MKTEVKIFPHSSQIQQISYEEEKHQLTVIFKNGSTYRYSHVAKSVYDAACEAESIGSFIARNIKGQYKTDKI